MTGTQTLGWVGALVTSLGIAAFVTIAVASPTSYPRQMWARYEYWLEQELRLLMLNAKAHHIARVQLAIVAILVMLAFIGQPLLLVLAVACIAGPRMWVSVRRRNRVLDLEHQLESWLQLLASSLRATASIGAAVESTANLVPDPLRQEVDLIIKKMRLGVPLERALMEMAGRADSPAVSGALSALVIGQRTGGDVAALLERAADSLREMARLEGLVRAKMAQGQMQAIVLAVAPAVLVLGLRWLKEDWFDPLLTESTGNFILGFAIALWIAAVAIARKILRVED